MPPTQLEALSRLFDLLEIGKKYSVWDAEIYLVRGDPPYKYADVDIFSRTETEIHRLSQENLIKWLEFEKELDELNNELQNDFQDSTPVESLVDFMRGDPNE